VDDTLESIFGPLDALPAKIRDASNQWAALEAQNADIAGGRWTLNNAAYQFNQLTPVGQLAVMAMLAYVISSIIAKV
jgi:hypothetical protein